MPCHNLFVEQPSQLPRLDPAKIRLSSLWHLRRVDMKMVTWYSFLMHNLKECTHMYTEIEKQTHTHTRL